MTSATNRNLAGLLTKPARLPFVVTSAVRAVTTRSRAFSVDRRVKGWLLPCTALLPALLTVGWLVADARQSGDYSPVRQTVSVLAGHEATDRWIVTGALYLVGVGYLVAAWGLAAVGPPAQLGLAVAGAAAFGVATFPVAADGTSRPHAVCVVIGALTIALWPALVARRGSPALNAVGLRASITAMVVSVALFAWTALEIHGSKLGLAERMSSSLQVCWPFVIAVALRRGARAQDSGSATL